MLAMTGYGYGVASHQGHEMDFRPGFGATATARLQLGRVIVEGLLGHVSGGPRGEQKRYGLAVIRQRVGGGEVGLELRHRASDDESLTSIDVGYYASDAW